jgi:hypothetical protein
MLWGWFDVYEISVSLKVGFLNIEIFMLRGSLWMIMSRKLSLLSCSNSPVNVRAETCCLSSDSYILIKFCCVLTYPPCQLRFVIRTKRG